jgi:uncharacterized phage protein (TIGR02216 family)
MLRFPFDDAIGFGLGVLRLSPDQFWRMTPRELMLAARALNAQGLASAAPMTRTDFTALMQRYPDGRRDDR